MAFKMKGHALPGIKQAFKKYKSDAQRKAVHASKADAAMKKTGAKPDYIDIDKDGNTTESMKSAASSMKMYGKKSPMKNYKNPKDYKVFNMGNEASPSFKKHKKKGY
tara:strand:+ start:414 stop:734 length:321 start_codon:yes stop_codon:yes gene_type:complete